MSLKTNYKNDIYSGKRKYVLTNNDDGTVSLDDATQYQQTGDIFSAEDINATNSAINSAETEIQKLEGDIQELRLGVDITVPVSGWSGTAPYTQTISIARIKESRPVIAKNYIGEITAVSINLQDKARNCVERITVNNGSITLYCYNQKPQNDFGIAIKGAEYE